MLLIWSKCLLLLFLLNFKFFLGKPFFLIIIKWFHLCEQHFLKVNVVIIFWEHLWWYLDLNAFCLLFRNFLGKPYTLSLSATVISRTLRRNVTCNSGIVIVEIVVIIILITGSINLLWMFRTWLLLLSVSGAAFTETVLEAECFFTLMWWIRHANFVNFLRRLLVSLLLQFSFSSYYWLNTGVKLLVSLALM